MSTLAFHTSLYDRDAVLETRDAFGHLATIDVDEADEHCLSVTFAAIDERVADRLVDAFANHALAMTIQRHKAGGPLS